MGEADGVALRIWIGRVAEAIKEKSIRHFSPSVGEEPIEDRREKLTSFLEFWRLCGKGDSD